MNERAVDRGPGDATWWRTTDHVLARHDGSEWVTFEPPDWMPIDVAGWRLVEDEWVPVANTPWWDVSPVDEPAPFPEDEFMGGSWGETRVAADGSVWLAARLGLYDSALARWWRRCPPIPSGFRALRP